MKPPYCASVIKKATVAKYTAIIGAISLLASPSSAQQNFTPSDCLMTSFSAFAYLSEQWAAGENNGATDFEHSLLYHEVRLTMCHSEILLEKDGTASSFQDMLKRVKEQSTTKSSLQRYRISNGHELAFADSVSCVTPEQHSACVEAISQ